MFFGLDTEKLLLIGVLAVLVVGPERLPRVAAAFARFVARARTWTQDAKTRIKDEMGDDFDDVEWRKLDPRQYDPRRIVREALIADPEPRMPVTPAPASAVPPAALEPVAAVESAPDVAPAAEPSAATSIAPESDAASR